MSCSRCRGLLIQCNEQHWLHWKCLSCGDRFDSVVMTNRYLSKPPAWMVAESLLAELRGSPAA